MGEWHTAGRCKQVRALEELGRTRLSTHFFFRDFLYSEIAQVFGILNVPDNPDLAIEAGSRLCSELLEPLKATFGDVRIRSGFRSTKLNALGHRLRIGCANNERNFAGHIWDRRDVLYRALAAAELAAPASEQGAFIAAGNELDAYAAISKVLALAKGDLLIVDPYMDGKALTDFMPSAAEGVVLRVLADEGSVKPTLAPAIEKWRAQFEGTRPLEVRLAPARSLHDRLIVVDEGEAWSLTQSFKDFANRAHGAVLKTDAETAVLKIAAYVDLWNHSRPI